jgi:diguanylate cyclase (GGDEF)-like protein
MTKVNERRSRPREAPDLRRLAKSLLAEAMEAVEGVSGTVWLLDPDQTFRAVATVGEGARTEAIDPGDILRRHEEIFQGTPFFEQENGRVVFHGIFLPLVHDESLAGLVHIRLAPSSGKGAPDLFPRLRRIAEDNAPLIQAACAIERLRLSPLKDGDSEAYNESFLLDFLAREITRARRYRRRLGLMAIEIDGVQALNRGFGHRMAQGLLRDLVEALRGTLRESDVIAHAGEFRLLVGLPDTDRLGCRVAAEKVRKGMRQIEYLRERLDRYKLVPHVGHSCFPDDGRDRDAMLTAALTRAATARKDPFLRGSWKEMPFWSTLESIMKSPGREEVEKTPDTAHGIFPTSFLYLLQEAIGNDIAQHPMRRGLLYIGTNNVYVTEALIQKNPHLAKAATRISVLGDLTGMQSLREFNINAVPVSKDLATTFQFVIHLSDLYAYAICAILKKGDNWEGFHTSNDSLVEDLIFKLRDEYGLQEQI